MFDEFICSVYFSYSGCVRIKSDFFFPPKCETELIFSVLGSGHRNLILSNQIRVILVCGPKSDTRPSLGSVTGMRSSVGNALAPFCRFDLPVEVVHIRVTAQSRCRTITHLFLTVGLDN